MLKWIARIAGTVVALGLLAGWWLFAGFSGAPKAAPGVVDIESWRSMVREAGGDLPTEVRILEVGADAAPMLAARAGAFGGTWLTSYNAVQLVFPEHTIVIGGALDRLTAKGMVQSEDTWSFDDEAYGQLTAAMLKASQVLITHEHLDHIMAVARHPDPAALAPLLTLNAPQVGDLPKFALGMLDPALAELAPRLDGTVQLVAPGVVVIPMAGHTPGSQLVFITLQDGREYLMIGDIVWTMTAIEELTMRPVFTQYIVFDPDEDRGAIGIQIRALHDLMQAEPDLLVFASHDRVRLDELAEKGHISWGFTDQDYR